MGDAAGFPLVMKLGVWLLMLAVSMPVQAELDLIAMDGQKIVSASTVRVRARPVLTADIVGYLSLGTVVSASQRTKNKSQTGAIEHYWYFVQADDKQGWVSGSLLQDFQSGEKEQIWFKLIKERLDSETLSFPDRMALYRFADLTAKNAHSEKLKGAFELGRLLALQKSFDQLNYDALEKEPYAAWVMEHKVAGRVFHDEISGQWLVPSVDYWELADKYKGSAAGDEVAWYAANARLGGECEGDISCGLGRKIITQGEYLKRFPYGRYANASLQRVNDTLKYIRSALKDEPDYFRKVPECGEQINSLKDIITSSNPKLSERAIAFGQIKALAIAFDKQR